jgi:tetratricopeptide (TPR) repeat protein
MDSITLSLRDAERDAVASFNAGLQAHAEGDAQTALRLWNQAWDRSRALLPAAQNLLALHLDAGNYAAADAIYTELLLEDPFDANLWVRQAALRRRLGRFESARDGYLRAIAIHPYFRYWHDELAEIYALLGQPEAAARQRERALGLDADMVELAYDDAMVHLRAGHHAIASACAEAILEDFPAHTEARLLLVEAHAREGALDEARTSIEEALVASTSETSLRLRFERAKLLAAADPATAADDITTVLRAEPRFGRAVALAQSLGLTLEAPDADVAQPAETAVLSHERLATLAGGAFGGDAPRLLTPDPRLPWQLRVDHLLRQALAIPSPALRPGRVALVVEPAAASTPIVIELLGLLMQPDFALEFDPAHPRLCWFEADASAPAIANAGWLGSPELPQIQPHGWDATLFGLPLEAALDALHEAGGSEGFNLILFVGSGCLPDLGTDAAKRLRHLPVYQMAHLGGASGNQLQLRLSGLAPNWVDLPTG